MSETPKAAGDGFGSIRGLWSGGKDLSEQDWRRIFDAFSDPVAILDRSFHIIYANKAMADRIGREGDACRGLVCCSCLHRTRSPVDGCPNLMSLRDRRPHTSEVCVQAWGGHYAVTTMPILDDEGEVMGTVHVAHELSQQRMEERRATEAQRTESLRQMAGGLAHELNNVIHVILANARLLENTPDIPLAAKLNLDEILGSGMRAAELAKQLLLYAGRNVTTSAALDLNDVLREQESILKGLVGWRAPLAFRPAEALPPTAGDKEQVGQAVQALVLNAAEAVTPPNDEITLRTGLIDADRNYLNTCVLGYAMEPGECVYIDVEDRGCGMTDRTVEHLFEPFFTTKFVGRGMGLSSVLGIMRSHGGAIHVASEVGRGTTMRLLFPVRRREASPPSADARPVPAAAERRAALIADDEPAILRIMEVVARSAGCEPKTTGDGLEAVALFEASPDNFCVAVLDVTMPRLNGAEAAKRIHALRPDLPIILCSGYTEAEVRVMTGESPRNTIFVQKPYEISRMRELLVGIAGTVSGG